MSKVKSRRLTPPTRLFLQGVFAAFAVLVIIGACMLSSCNVTRTITTKSEYFKSGDTTCTIVTKTTETYDAKKNQIMY